ncbi:MAG: prolyl oligopeptidase family serine peptidase [Gemmataceae bacterium]
MTSASGQTAYRQPPKIVREILDVPPPPTLTVNPTRTHAIAVQSARNPSIVDVAEPMLRLAGLRINPRTNGPARQSRITALSIVDLAKPGEFKAIPLPAGKVGSLDWSPDGKKFAVAVTTDKGIGLWMGDTQSATLQEIPGVTLNAVTGDPIQWLSGSDVLLVKSIPAGRGKPPEAPLAPIGPTTQESSGNAAPVRTYQDLLKDAHDEELFEYYATNQLVRIDAGKATPLGKPGLHVGASPSPDGTLLLVTTINKPYSYLYPLSSFPKTVSVWDAKSGQVKHVVAEKPLEDAVPIEGVPTGPRSIQWIANEPHRLVWTEALDGGNPKTKAEFRDQLYTLDPTAEKPAKVAGMKVTHRFMGISFFETGSTAIVRDYDRERRWSRTLKGDFSQTDGKWDVVFERSMQDRYGDPGTPIGKTLPNGERVLRTIDGKLVLSGLGASAKGERPFLDLFDLTDKKATRIWQCGERVYETAQLLSDDGKTLLVRRESPTDPGNYLIKTADKETVLTHNVDPAPILRQVKKQLVTTKRPDGVTISFTLYTPPGYEPGKTLPTVFWAYPREFNSASDAGQISGSPYRFTTVSSYSHLFFVLLGYAVMDEVSMPIVGPVETANDTFLEQLVANAKAAIDKGVEMGVVDRGRIGAGGHSYGAFMTANLLAHSDLFRTGVARSGAYNRTLTPFGFQNERRTFWEAPEVYSKMSPFNSAHKIKEPILLIHGAADDNPGTFPVQSERLYAAIRGNGGTVRLVMLPHEAHGYLARESTDHVLAETIEWFDKYVKNAPTK